MADECLAMGLYISFAGMVTYKKSDDLRAVAASVPDDRILVETDSPYLSPEPVRKIKRNEPAQVGTLRGCLAEVRGVTLGNVCNPNDGQTRETIVFTRRVGRSLALHLLLCALLRSAGRLRGGDRGLETCGAMVAYLVVALPLVATERPGRCFAANVVPPCVAPVGRFMAYGL